MLDCVLVSIPHPHSFFFYSLPSFHMRNSITICQIVSCALVPNSELHRTLILKRENLYSGYTMCSKINVCQLCFLRLKKTHLWAHGVKIRYTRTYQYIHSNLQNSCGFPPTHTFPGILKQSQENFVKTSSPFILTHLLCYHLTTGFKSLNRNPTQAETMWRRSKTRRLLVYRSLL